MNKSIVIWILFISSFAYSQTDQRVYEIIKEVSAKRIETDVRTLANFGCRVVLANDNEMNNISPRSYKSNN